MYIIELTFTKLNFDLVGAGFPPVWGGGSYPGYESGSQRPHYAAPADLPSPGYYPPYASTHGADISSIGVSPGVSAGGYHVGSITPAPGIGYPPAGAPPVHAGSAPPIGGASIGVSSITPYPPPFSGGIGGGGLGGSGLAGSAFYPGLENRPFNVRCDDQEQFKQVKIKFINLRSLVIFLRIYGFVIYTSCNAIGRHS